MSGMRVSMVTSHSYTTRPSLTQIKLTLLDNGDPDKKNRQVVFEYDVHAGQYAMRTV